MSRYRNHPGGMGSGMSENLTRTMRCVSLDDICAIGNRAQRRWAKKKLTKIERRQAGASADVSTPPENNRAAAGTPPHLTKGM